MLFHTSPLSQSLKTFGCSYFPLPKPYTDHKLQPKSTQCIFLGYPPLSKGYISLDPHTHKVYITAHVNFTNLNFLLFLQLYLLPPAILNMVIPFLTFGSLPFYPVHPLIPYLLSLLLFLLSFLLFLCLVSLLMFLQLLLMFLCLPLVKNHPLVILRPPNLLLLSPLLSPPFLLLNLLPLLFLIPIQCLLDPNMAYSSPKLMQL